MTFVPPDLESQLSALSPKDCPYCQAFPAVPCVLHRRQPEIFVKGTSVGPTLLQIPTTSFLIPEARA